MLYPYRYRLLIKYRQLYLFTCIQVDRARRLAALGKKDDARDILRFIQNACIVDILKPYSGEMLIDAYLLESNVRDLTRECHPSCPSEPPTDLFSAILERLDLIAAHVGGVAGPVVVPDSEKEVA